MICSAGQPEEQPDPKNRLFLRGAVGVWNCESSDRIKGCDGACIHAVGSLAGAGGWSITNVAAFPVFPAPQFHPPLRYNSLDGKALSFPSSICSIFNMNCG